MKHIFILNPAAGRKDAEKKILPGIMEAAKATGIDYEIHRTMNIGDGENYVRSRCLAMPHDSLRFYAIGGDGTLNEVANGAFGFSNAEIGFIPSGTGNDFARIFTEPKNFLDIRKQIKGTAQPIDLIKYEDRVVVNVLNIGLDCAVVTEMNKLKKRLRLGGPLAYMAGVGVVFARNRGFHLKVILEEGTVYEKEYTLAAIGNGSYYGGGFKGIPKAEIDDGLLDISLISKVSRRTFASLIGKYRKGTHLESPGIEKIITYIKCKSITIESKDDMEICIDGEVLNTGELKISIIPSAIKFCLPEGSRIHQ
jgi:YegS/Rv2252/BmrU family lipid kinase